MNLINNITAPRDLDKLISVFSSSSYLRQFSDACVKAINNNALAEGFSAFSVIVSLIDKTVASDSVDCFDHLLAGLSEVDCKGENIFYLFANLLANKKLLILHKHILSVCFDGLIKQAIQMSKLDALLRGSGFKTVSDNVRIKPMFSGWSRSVPTLPAGYPYFTMFLYLSGVRRGDLSFLCDTIIYQSVRLPKVETAKFILRWIKDNPVVWKQIGDASNSLKLLRRLDLVLGANDELMNIYMVFETPPPLVSINQSNISAAVPCETRDRAVAVASTSNVNATDSGDVAIEMAVMGRSIPISPEVADTNIAPQLKNTLLNLVHLHIQTLPFLDALHFLIRALDKNDVLGSVLRRQRNQVFFVPNYYATSSTQRIIYNELKPLLLNKKQTGLEEVGIEINNVLGSINSIRESCITDLQVDALVLALSKALKQVSARTKGRRDEGVKGRRGQVHGNRGRRGQVSPCKKPLQRSL